VICGPTASGKTGFAIQLAIRFAGEIIGADSMQIYRRMDIGTAKPTPEETRTVPHHMVDVVDPDESYDAERFAAAARGVISDLLFRKRLPLVVGGTGLYIKALVHGLFTMPRVDPGIREQLQAEIEKTGATAAFDRLRRVDLISAERIHPNDTHRIIRALEVYDQTGTPLSELQARHRFRDHPYRVLKIGLHMERERLYARIDRRAEEMLDAGLVDEVLSLLASGYDFGLKPMQSIGYRHVCEHLKGQTTREEMIRTLKRDTRRYAKRQMTWFRADPEIRWIAPDNIEKAAAMVKRFLNSG